MLANLFVTGLAAFAGGLLGIFAVLFIFLAPGVLTWKRDLLLFGCLSLALAFAWGGKYAVCEVFSELIERCDANYVRGDVFINCISALFPIMMLWSWIRFGIFRQNISGKK
jgi:hypothetical protein